MTDGGEWQVLTREYGAILGDEATLIAFQRPTPMQDVRVILPRIKSCEIRITPGRKS